VGVFLCGKPAMVDDVKNQLIALGIPAGNIKDEKY
jgi:NAD(P)H-flavin reductase